MAAIGILNIILSEKWIFHIYGDVVVPKFVRMGTSKTYVSYEGTEIYIEEFVRR